MKATIKSSLPSRKQHFKLDCSHLTTMTFMRTQPVYYRRLIPGQSIKVDVNSFARLADMPCPTFGSGKLRMLGFFVPYRTCWSPFNDFIGQTITPRREAASSSQTIPSVCAYLSNDALVQFITSSDFCEVVTSGAFDAKLGGIAIDTERPAHAKLKFNNEGRYILKVLMGLGIVPDFTLSTGLKFNALDVLAFIRIHVDWLYSNQYVNDNVYIQAMAMLDDVAENKTQEILQVLEQVIFTMVPYSSNYFTDCFANPLGYNNSQSMPNVSITSSDVKENNNGVIPTVVSINPDSTYSTAQPHTVALNTNSLTVSATSRAFSQLTSLSSQMIDNLYAMTAYVRRMTVAGSRSYERLYSMFGIKPDAAVFNRSYYLGDYSVPLQISDVMSTASTDGASLGSYAGKGFIVDTNKQYGTFSFDNDTTDFGVFMLIAYIEPDVIYPYGIDGMQLDLSPLSFYSGDFDGLGTEPIVAAELYQPITDVEHVGESGYVDISNYSDMFKQVFGFNPRYARYKTKRDWLTGDFRFGSSNAAGLTSSQWHFARQIDGSDFTATNDFVVDKSFLMPVDSNQFNRIFYNVDNSDHFVTNFLFRVNTYANMKPLYSFDEFEHFEDEHKDVTVDVKGIQKS